MKSGAPTDWQICYNFKNCCYKLKKNCGNKYVDFY